MSTCLTLWRALLLDFLCGGAVAAPAPIMALHHLTRAKGLLHDTAMAAAQDAQGHSWFTTEAGRDRWDGHVLHRCGRERGTGISTWSVVTGSAVGWWLAVTDTRIARFDRRSGSAATLNQVYKRKVTMPDARVRALRQLAVLRRAIAHGGLPAANVGAQSLATLAAQLGRAATIADAGAVGALAESLYPEVELAAAAVRDELGRRCA